MHDLGRRKPLLSESVEPLPGDAVPPVGRKAPKLDQPRLLRVQLQIELLEPCPQFGPEPFSVAPVLEARDEVVAVAYDDHISSCVPPPPSLGPKVQDVVEVDVR